MSSANPGTPRTHRVKTLILGAGAAGLFCAGFAAPAGPVLVVDHARAAGDKIRISGGGRCNFTNIHAGPGNFLSQNPHFAKSALARFTAADFIDLVRAHKIPFHEKTLGQLFCDTSAKDIIALLLARAKDADIWLETSIDALSHGPDGFSCDVSHNGKVRRILADHVVVATGGKSIPKMGATGLGYQIATQFGLKVEETRPGLVPLTFGPQDLEMLAPLAGTALDVRARALGPEGATAKQRRARPTPTFDEALLFTHRGLSGPAILQISSFWREGEAISVDLLGGRDGFAMLRAARGENGRRNLSSVMGDILPKRLGAALSEAWGLNGNIADQSDKVLKELADQLANWTLKPNGSEGYRTAEVTLGGVSTRDLDAHSMAAKTVPNLYFIGEVVDVTGWLGGYNFQWAWSSAAAAGRAIGAHR